ncbi:MAG: glycosyltransferase family 4 protein [candidate division WOR-3 bacterium]
MAKKFLLVFNRFFPVVSGSEVYSKQIFDYLKEKNFDVDVYTLKISDDSYEKNDKLLESEENFDGSLIKRFSLINFPYKNRIMKYFEEMGLFKYYSLNFKILSPSLVFNLEKNVKKYDVIITGFLPFASIVYPALFYSKKYGKKTVFIPLLHSTIPNTERFSYEFFHPYYRNLYELSDILVYHNSYEKDYLENFAKKTFQLNSYIKIPAQTSKGEKGIFNILSIGRQNYEKGIETSLKATKILYSEFKNIRFTIVGKIDKKYVKNLDEEFIVYYPFVSEQKKEELFLKTDVFLLPSIAESFGIVSVEAHSYGIPTINSYCWGSCYIVKNGFNGFLVPFKDHILTYNYLKQIYLDEKLKKMLSENAREISINGSQQVEGYKDGPFDKNRFVKQFEKILEYLL